MIYPEYNLVDTAVGDVAKRNNIRDVMTVLTGIDAYRTYFRYPEAFREYFNRNIDPVTKLKSVGRYPGPAYADFFPIDIDVKDDIPKALELLINTLCVIESKYDVNIKELRVFFSGSKGFHLYIPAEMMGIAPSANISRYFRQFASQILKPMGIEYDSTIYDIVRLWRVSNTINSKSGLYKIELTVDEVFKLTVEEIKELAKSPRKTDHISDVLQNPILTALYRSVQETATISGEPIVTGACPRNEKPCIHKLMQGVGEGKRDAVCFRLAGHWRKKGISSDITEAMMQTWNRLNHPPMSDREITDKVRSAYRDSARADFGCNDEILREYCSAECYLKNRNVSEEPSARMIYTFEDALSSYKTYVHESPFVRITLPIPKIGPAMRGISPGECLYIIARAGVGKTAGLLNLFQWIARGNREPMLFFSLEQPVPQIFERQAQLATGMGGNEIEFNFRHCPEKAKMITEVTRESFSNIMIVDKSGLSVEDVEETIRVAERDVCGKKIRLIALDYMGLLNGKGKDLYAQVSGQAKNLQAMLKNVGTAGIVLSQVNRAGGSGDQKITMEMIRDSGVVEEAASFIIGMWRQKEDQDMIRMELLKTKHGALGVFHDFRFIKPSLRFDDPDKTLWNDKIFDAGQFGEDVPMV